MSKAIPTKKGSKGIRKRPPKAKSMMMHPVDKRPTARELTREELVRLRSLGRWRDCKIKRDHGTARFRMSARNTLRNVQRFRCLASMRLSRNILRPLCTNVSPNAISSMEGKVYRVSSNPPTSSKTDFLMAPQPAQKVTGDSLEVWCT